MTDRERVIACGLTDDEADCWELAATLARKLFELPKLHQMDDREVAHAIHVIQNKLLGDRPTASTSNWPRAPSTTRNRRMHRKEVREK